MAACFTMRWYWVDNFVISIVELSTLSMTDTECPFQLSLSLSLSIITAIFPGEPGLAGFIAAKDDGGGGDNWSYKTCKATLESSPPTNQHPAF